MLKRNHQDVQLVRKNMTRFALPAADTASDPPVLTLKDYVPKKKKEDVKGPTMAENRLNNLSILLSRSYLLLIAQVFRSMSRHLSDRHELGILIDGLNRIMVNHGRDIGIVAQAMIGTLFRASATLAKFRPNECSPSLPFICLCHSLDGCKYPFSTAIHFWGRLYIVHARSYQNLH